MQKTDPSPVLSGVNFAIALIVILVVAQSLAVGVLWAVGKVLGLL